MAENQTDKKIEETQAEAEPIDGASADKKNNTNHQQKKPKQRLKMQDHPVAGWSKKQTIAAGIICLAVIVVAFAFFVKSGGFGYHSKNGGMINNPAWKQQQEKANSDADGSGKSSASVDSENIEYTSNDIDKKGCETLAAMVLDKSKQSEDYSLRQYFYSRGLSGMRYETHAYLSSITSQTSDHINKKVAKAIGMRYSTFVDNYSWLIVTGHKGSTYNGNKYGFDIYWVGQGLTTEDAQTRVDVLYYNTKSKTYHDGTMKVIFLRKNAVGLDEKSYEASK